MFLSLITLLWQLFILFLCCLGTGLILRFFIPKDFSPLSKVLFSLVGGLFLVVLIAENLVFLGIPVRISAWFLLAAALVQLWLCRHKLLARRSAISSNPDLRTLAAVVLVTIAFHGIVPCRQGLQWYAGKGYPDYYNYVMLAEFLKEEPYSTGEQEVGLRPWVVNPATWLKRVRIGQSIVTAEISVWSWTDAKTGYPATVIFFLSVLSICVFVFLRQTGIDRFMAGSGALLAALLPAVTRLSLDGFLSQVSILFLFPFFAALLQHQNLRARSFTLFFSLALAYLLAAYSEIAPVGFCTLFLGLMFVRQDKFRTKRLMLMSSILLIVLMNPLYLSNLIEFLAQQYNIAAHWALLDYMSPDILTLRGWSELVFGAMTNLQLGLLFDYWAILLGILFLAGVAFLRGHDRRVFGAVLVPILLVVLYLVTRNHPSSYPIAKITLSILPFLVGLVFVALARVSGNYQNRPAGLLKKLFAVFIVASAAAGSARYYSQVLNSEGLLRVFREPHFLNVCRELEQIKNKRVYVVENDVLLTPWLCYHARHNDVYVEGQFISPSAFARVAPFSQIPDPANVDFEVTDDQIIDLKIPSASRYPLSPK